MAALNQKALLDMLNPDGAQGAMPMPPIDGGSAAQNAAEPGGFAGPAAQGMPQSGGNATAPAFKSPAQPNTGTSMGALSNGTDTIQLPQVDPSKATGPLQDNMDGNTGPIPIGNVQPTDAGSGNPTIDAFNAAKGKGFMVGFDPSKLNSDYADTKYSPAAKFTAQASQMMPISRGNLQDFVGLAQSQGFKNAKMVGDDKVDFGDGNGPIDIIRADGQPVFQNTTGNAQWEGQYGGAGGGGGHDAGGGGISMGSIDPRLGGDPLAAIQQALGAYQNSPNLQALLSQLGGR
jgi:hypothetical protein